MGAILALMVNTNRIKMVQPKRVFRQHNSFVVTLPVLVREKLELKIGDYVLFEWSKSRKSVKLVKFETEKTDGRKND